MKRLSWEDVTFKKYLQIKKVMEEEGDELDKALSFLRILTGTDYSKVPINEYMEKVAELSFLQTDLPTIDVPKTINVNGKKYKVIYDADNMSTAQFFDYMNYIKMPTDEKIAYLTAVFLLPDNAKVYNEGYDFQEVVNDVMDMPLQIVNSIAFFLLTKSRASLKHSLYSLMGQTMMNKSIKWKEKKKVIKGVRELLTLLEYSHIF